MPKFACHSKYNCDFPHIYSFYYEGERANIGMESRAAGSDQPFDHDARSRSNEQSKGAYS